MNHWTYVGMCYDGQPFQLQGLDVWKLHWKATNEIPARVKDPLYGQNFSFRVYQISDNVKTVEFAAGEFSNCCWGFFQRSNCLKTTANSETVAMCFIITIRTPQFKSLEGLRQGYPYVSIGDRQFAALQTSFDAIKQSTGKTIDLYDWIEFSGSELGLVEDEIAKQKNQVDQDLEDIVVKFEAQNELAGRKEELVYGLSLLETSNIIQRILALITFAKVDGKVLVFKGP